MSRHPVCLIELELEELDKINQARARTPMSRSLTCPVVRFSARTTLMLAPTVRLGMR